MLTSWLANKTTPSLQESIQVPGVGHQVCSWSCAYSPCVYCSLSCFRSNMMVWFLVWTLFHIFSTSFTLHFISRFYCAVFHLKLPDPTSFFFILFWTWTMFLFFLLCSSLLHRHKTACQIRSRSQPMEPTSAISHTCGRIQVLCEPRPYFSWSGCFTSKVFLSDLWWWGRGSCSRISARPAPVTTKVMVIPLRAGEREEEGDSYFTAHCVRHTPHGCFEACAQARSPDWGLVAGLQRIKAECAVEEFHLWALVEAQCRLSLSSLRTMCNQRFIEVGSACIFSPILAEFFDTAELFLLQLSRATSWRNLRVLSNFETSQDSNSNC